MSIKALSIQVQPHRCASMDVEKVRAALASITASALVKHHSFNAGLDRVEYLNFTFGAEDIRALWDVMQARIYAHEELGPAMRQSSMAVCEGQDGWNDYLLLYHFDPAVPCDSL